MKKITPLTIVASLCVGIMVFICTTCSMFENVDSPIDEVTSHVKIKLLKSDTLLIETSNKDSATIKIMKNDTVAIKFFSKPYSTVDSIYIDASISDATITNLRRINIDAYLNLNPDLFNWVIFHSVLIAFSITFLLVYFMVLDPILWLNEKQNPKSIEVISIFVVIVTFAFFFYYLTSLSKVRIWDGIRILEIFKIGFESPRKIIGTVVLINFAIACIIVNVIIHHLFKLERERTGKTSSSDGAVWKFCSKFFTKRKTADDKEGNTEEEMKKVPEANPAQNELIYEVFEKKQDLHYTIRKVNSPQSENPQRTIIDVINYCSFALSLLVSASIIGSAIQRQMIGKLIKGLDYLYPYSFVFSYGIVFSFILALLLIPSYIYINNEATLKDKTGLQSTLDTLKVIFIVLLPLLSAFMKLFVKI